MTVEVLSVIPGTTLSWLGIDLAGLIYGLLWGEATSPLSIVWEHATHKNNGNSGGWDYLFWKGYSSIVCRGIVSLCLLGFFVYLFVWFLSHTWRCSGDILYSVFKAWRDHALIFGGSYEMLTMETGSAMYREIVLCSTIALAPCYSVVTL